MGLWVMNVLPLVPRLCPSLPGPLAYLSRGHCGLGCSETGRFQAINISAHFFLGPSMYVNVKDITQNNSFGHIVHGDPDLLHSNQGVIGYAGWYVL